MLNTDIKGLWEELRNNQIVHLILLFSICFFLYSLLSKYMKEKSQFNDILILKGIMNMNNVNNMNSVNNMNNSCNKDITRIDKDIISNTINLPNRNPDLLTSSMVYPNPSIPSEEDVRKTRMDVLNMFYDTFDDDVTSITSRPQNLYITP